MEPIDPLLATRSGMWLERGDPVGVAVAEEDGLELGATAWVDAARPKPIIGAVVRPDMMRRLPGVE